MFENVLIANRGEIACRIVRTARRLGMRTIALATPADRGALHTRCADEAHEIGVGAEGYLDGEAIVTLAKRVGAECVHPGYGFLSENADFAALCEQAGLVFVGPSPAAMRALGLKHAAKALMAKLGVPVAPGYSGDNQTAKFLKEKAYEIGYPVLIKAVAGGGGRGMRRVDAHVEFEAALEAAAREAANAFGDARVLIEKYVAAARHIEVQVFGDRHGNVVHMFERDCSLQRRRQKVVEESPAPGLPEATRTATCEAAVAAARAVDYAGAGTVEFLVDSARGLGPDSFYFLEMNARLQVEHPVTEAITGLDLVEWQFRVAAGEKLPLDQSEIRCRGAAIEARVNAEDPETGFLPSPGRILALRLDAAPALRVETGVEADDEVTPFYDSLIAKLIASGPDRQSALEALRGALGEAVVVGPRTNLAFLDALLADSAVQAGGVDVGFIDANAARLGAEPRPPDPRAVLAGAAALIAPPPMVEAGDPWGVADAFELTAPRRTGFEILVDGRLERLVAIEPASKRWLAFADERVVVAEGPPWHVFRVGDAAYVLCGGRQTCVERIDPMAGGAGGREGESGEVVAPMHGRVIAISINEGDDVVAGQRVAVVEAMKMEHALVAPRAGRAEHLAAKLGDVVEQGQRLLTIATVET
jgi:3-methylcrotonyl-CoA carboxylase alpha subunit